MESMIGVPVFVGIFAIALVMGAVVNKTNFCTMGGVSDWVNIGDKARLGAWFLASAVAVLGVIALETLALVDLGTTRPPYRTASFAWLRYLLGGLMFGVGMTLASGCASKTIVRLGGGNLKSLLVVIVVGIFAYLMTKTDFYGIAFHSWMQPLVLDLSAFNLNSQDLGTLIGGTENAGMVRLIVGIVFALIVLLFIARNGGVRNNGDNWLAGIVVGLAITGAWYLTGGAWGQEWIEAAEWLDERPEGVAVQSLSFVNPMAETLNYIAQPKLLFLTIGVASVAGMFLGSLCYALISRSFRFEWFASWSDFYNHAIGAMLMGIGGVLAMGCTIGQGISGVSTLALGSFLALGSIILGSATTMKIQYYKMLYEDASWFDALLSGWADLHLLPNSLRRLEAL